jgi:hypothetical protein
MGYIRQVTLRFAGDVKVKTIVAGLAMAVLLVACDTVEGMRGMKDAQSQIKGLIGDEIGVEPLVGFNMSGGEPVDVSVAFSASDVPDRSVSELVRATRSAVQSTFDTRPLAIYIQIATTAE